MGWSEIWKVVLGVVTSVGGVGIIIVACAKFASGMIATRLEQKYSLKIEKDLEAYKAELEKDFEDYKQGLSKEMERYRTSLAAKNYVSKTRFDAEFEIYRKLSLAYFEMIKMITNLIPPGFASEIADEQKESEREKKLYLQSNGATIAAQDMLRANEPFISENFFDKYYAILIKCQQQLSAYERRWNVGYIAPQKEKERFTPEEYQKSEKIREDMSSLNKEIRAYLSELEVIDNQGGTTNG